jgi:predicted phosphodiesterase
MSMKTKKILLLLPVLSILLSFYLTSTYLIQISYGFSTPNASRTSGTTELAMDNVPLINFDPSRTLRLAIVGDIDSNSGLTEEMKIANKYNVQALIIPGDYEYTSGTKVLSDLQSHGFTKDNTDITVGNHDSGQDVEYWLNDKSTFGEVDFAFSANKLALFNIDANEKFDCSSPQFTALKSQIESSNAWYKFAVVHQPFVTVKSEHPPNGEFNCYDPMFREGGIDGVFQAHNHNYQRFDINGLLYGVFGTGTHDTGSSMYPINSDNWNGNTCLKCITGENGITIVDLQIDDQNSKRYHGWFISLDNTILDQFEKVNLSHTNMKGK